MRDINFLLDEISEQDKKEVKDIIKRIKTKNQKIPKEVIFLRKFALSLMKQYAVKKSIPKVISAPHSFQLNTRTIQSIPEPLVLISRLTEVPKPVQLINNIPINDIPEPVRLTEVKSEIPVPAPEPLRLNDLHQAAPAPPVPRPIENKAIANAIKRELSVPAPN
ncbi:hypothetical protein HY500_01125 [Candidatus Woesearchaeota archaeon]|nr:hypothetical protein [Candidatus Woesearchaeota archaeon]